jgi:hypothetical protein
MVWRCRHGAREKVGRSRTHGRNRLRPNGGHVVDKSNLPLADIKPAVHEESANLVCDQSAAKKPAGPRDHSPDRLYAPL